MSGLFRLKREYTLEHLTKQPVEQRFDTPLLFVHGSWHGAWCWAEHFLPYFAEQGFESHALSIRGHGSSGGSDRLRWHRMRDYVEDVHRIASQLDRPPVIIGHSMGGFITQKYLAKYEAPAAVLLASVPPSGVYQTTFRFLYRHPLLFMKVNLTWKLYPLIQTPALAAEAFFSPDMDEETVKAYHQKLGDESYLAFLDMLFLDLPDPEEVDTPILVLGAENDRIFSTREVKSTAKKYGTEAHFFPNMAHDMMLEKDWRAVADHIIQWLKPTIS